MPWYSPPTRREVSLLLFSLTTFVLFYNLETSFTSSSQRTASLKKSADPSSAHWDEVIYGNWTWEEQKVAENAEKQKQVNDKTSVVSFDADVFGSVGVNDGIQDWGDQIPTTTVLKHVPGALWCVYLWCGSLIRGRRVYDHGQCVHSQWHVVRRHGRFVLSRTRLYRIIWRGLACGSTAF